MKYNRDEQEGAGKFRQLPGDLDNGAEGRLDAARFTVPLASPRALSNPRFRPLL